MRRRLTTRRAVLRAGLAGAGAGSVAVLAGCTPRSASPKPNRPSADDAVRAELRRSLSDLVDAYRTAMAAVPELVATAGSLLAEHLAHLAALGPGPTAPPSTTAVPAAATTSPTPAPSTGLATAHVRLIALESAASTATARLALRASGPLARLVASIAACEAAHAALLRSRR